MQLDRVQFPELDFRRRSPQVDLVTQVSANKDARRGDQPADDEVGPPPRGQERHNDQGVDAKTVRAMQTLSFGGGPSADYDYGAAVAKGFVKSDRSEFDTQLVVHDPTGTTSTSISVTQTTFEPTFRLPGQANITLHVGGTLTNIDDGDDGAAGVPALV